MQKNLISIIIPIYNVEKYLRQCLDSVINQTYKNLEIILVNDGSMDNSGKICDEYALKDSRIKVIHKQNGGLVSARNAGLNVAKGDYIAFVDGDDYIEFVTLDEILKLILNFDVDIVKYGFKIVYENKKSRKIFSKFERKKYIDEEKNILLQNIIKNNGIDSSISNCLFKRSIIEQYNIRIDEKISQGEDMCFLTKFLLHSNSMFLASNLFYYNYIQNSNSLTKKYSKTYVNSIINLIYEMVKILKDDKNESVYLNAWGFGINKFVFQMLFVQADFKFLKINEKINNCKYFISKIPSNIRKLCIENRISMVKFFPILLFYKGHFYFSLFIIYFLKMGYLFINKLKK